MLNKFFCNCQRICLQYLHLEMTKIIHDYAHDLKTLIWRSNEVKFEIAFDHNYEIIQKFSDSFTIFLFGIVYDSNGLNIEHYNRHKINGNHIHGWLGNNSIQKIYSKLKKKELFFLDDDQHNEEMWQIMRKSLLKYLQCKLSEKFHPVQQETTIKNMNYIFKFAACVIVWICCLYFT
jgi:hypothetical protein